MNYLYKLATTENVEIHYDAFKKKELVDCLATMRDIYFRLKQENQHLKIQISAREEEYKKLEDKYKELDKMCELYCKSLHNAELSQYKNNWNQLFHWLVEQGEKAWGEVSITFDDILDKMTELEQGETKIEVE